MNYSDIKQAGADLIALTLNGSPRWRVVVMAGLLTLGGAQVYGDSVYARKNEVTELQKQQFEFRLRGITDDILNAKRDFCEAQRAGRSATAWANHLERLKQDYRKLTGYSFTVPTCGEV